MLRESYQELAARTINNRLYDYEMETHALHGMASEIGEIGEEYAKLLDGYSFDYDHTKSELGDLTWFVAEYCTATNLEFAKFVHANEDVIRNVMYDYDKEIFAYMNLSRAVSKLQGLYQKSYQGHKFDESKAEQMVNDIIRAIMEYSVRIEFDFDDVLQTNIDKLVNRYPYGFETKHSVNRKEGDI